MAVIPWTVIVAPRIAATFQCFHGCGQVVDQWGNIVTNYSGMVTLSLNDNPTGATLSSASGMLTMSFSGGVATFSDLSIDLAGTGYTLHASIGGGLPDIDSNPFNIT